MKIKHVENIVVATQELQKGNTVKVQCFGHSMHPVFRNGAIVTITPQEKYYIGEAVCCRIKKWIIDGHFIVGFKEGKAIISDINGNVDGLADEIYGRLIDAEYE